MAHHAKKIIKSAFRRFDDFLPEKKSIDNQFLFPTFNENILCNFTAIARQNAINISQFRIKLNLAIKFYGRNSHLNAPRRTEKVNKRQLRRYGCGRT